MPPERGEDERGRRRYRHEGCGPTTSEIIMSKRNRTGRYGEREAAEEGGQVSETTYQEERESDRQTSKRAKRKEKLPSLTSAGALATRWGFVPKRTRGT